MFTHTERALCLLFVRSSNIYWNFDVKMDLKFTQKKRRKNNTHKKFAWLLSLWLPTLPLVLYSRFAPRCRSVWLFSSSFFSLSLSFMCIHDHSTVHRCICNNDNKQKSLECAHNVHNFILCVCVMHACSKLMYKCICLADIHVYIYKRGTKSTHTFIWAAQENIFARANELSS